jgi:hypothetical protein
LLLGLYFPLRFFFSFWTQMATTSLSSIHGRTETHQSAFVGEQKRKMGERSWSSSPVPGRLIHLLFVSTRLPMDCRTTTTPEKEEEEEEEPM